MTKRVLKMLPISAKIKNIQSIKHIFVVINCLFSLLWCHQVELGRLGFLIIIFVSIQVQYCRFNNSVFQNISYI